MRFLFTFLILMGAACLNAQVIAIGQAHSMFVCASGVPQSSGWNLMGASAIGDVSADHNTPMTVAGSIANITAVSAGDLNTIFLDNMGRIWACGPNGYGQLGNGTFTGTTTPILIPGTSGFIAISAGVGYALLLKNDGTVWSMGHNPFGQLGYVTPLQNSSVIAQIPTLSGIIAVSAGDYHSLFLKNDGTVWACGLNSSGQLANGNNTSHTVPFQCNIDNVISIAAGTEHSIFVKSDGTAWAAGRNGYGQLGDNTLTSRRNPVAVGNLTGVVKAISHGMSNGSYFLKSDGTCMATGINVGMIAINGTISNSLVPINAGPENIRDVAVNSDDALFLKNDNTIWTIGNSANGQLGTGTYDFVSTVTQLTSVCEPLLQHVAFETAAGQSVYPNPVSKILYLPESSTVKEVAIYTIDGKIIQQPGNDNSIDVSGLQPGIYLVIWRGAGNHILRKKFIKR